MKKTRLKHRQMSVEEALTFESNSPENDATVMMELSSRGTPGCTCLPRVDVFTMARWNAQGKKIKKGSKSVSITTFHKTEEINDVTGQIETSTKFGNARVFCRCQTEEMSQRHKDFLQNRRDEWQQKHPDVKVAVQ